MTIITCRDANSTAGVNVLQELNPTPFAAMILNHTGWVVYAVLHTDWFIFTMDASGLIIGTWMMFSLYPLAHVTVYIAHFSVRLVTSSSKTLYLLCRSRTG